MVRRLQGPPRRGPDSELITKTAVTAGSTGDVEPVTDLIADLIDPAGTGQADAAGADAAVYGDAAYGAGEVL